MSNEFSRCSASHFTELRPGGPGKALLPGRGTESIRGATCYAMAAARVGDEGGLMPDESV